MYTAHQALCRHFRHCDDLGRTFGSAFAALSTFFIIDMRQIIDHMDRIRLTLLLAQMTADTACAADCLHLGSSVLVRTLNGDLIIDRFDLDETFGTGLDTKAAAYTPVLIHDRDTVHHMDRILGADLFAGTKSDTAEAAFCNIDPGQHCTPAVLDPDIITLVTGDFAVSLAADERSLFFTGFRRNAHDPADLVGNRGTAYRTSVDRGFPFGNRSSHGITARISAGTAVITGKRFPDGGFPLIYFYIKLFGREYQTGTHYQADDGDPL